MFCHCNAVLRACGLLPGLGQGGADGFHFRRVAVRAQMLDSARPSDLHEVVRGLTLLQIDPVAAIAPSADLVAWSRLGSSYSPAELDAALEARTLLELRAMIRPYCGCGSVTLSTTAKRWFCLALAGFAGLPSRV